MVNYVGAFVVLQIQGNTGTEILAEIIQRIEVKTKNTE